MDEQKKIYSSFQELKSDCIKFVEASKNRGAYKGLKKLLTELYPDKAHFIYELLQNAEDQQADEVFFEVQNDKFIFKHNGKKRDFNLEDIDSITNIGNSTKKDDPTSIGKFGVGFKAVYAYTNTPEIHSGKYNFKIIDMLIPEDANVEQTSVTGETEFIFPFDNPSKSPSVAVSEIESTLNALDETAILFLRYIKSIKFKLLNGFEGEIFITPNISNIKYFYSITIKTTDEIRETLWAKFDNKCPIFVDGKKNDYIVSMSYKIKKEDEKYSVDSDLEGRVCIYFPTDQKSQLRFHINAPFASTVARDNIQYCDENEKLLDALADLAVASLYDLKKYKLLDYSAYEALPAERDFMNAPNSRYKIILKKITEEFEKAALFIDEYGEYKKQENIYQAKKDIKDIISLENIKRYYNRTYIPTFSPTKRIEFFLDQFEIEEYTIEDFINTLSSNPSFFDEMLNEKKSNDYNKLLYYLLSTARERGYWYYSRQPQNKEVLSKVRFILCDDQLLHSPSEKLYFKTDYKEKYIKNPIYVSFNEKKIERDNAAKNYLMTLGVQSMTQQIDIMSEFEGRDEISAEDVVIKLLEIIEGYNNSTNKQSYIEQFKDTPFVVAHRINSNDNELIRVKANECCWNEKVAFFYRNNASIKFVISWDNYEALNSKEIFMFREVFAKLGGKFSPYVYQTKASLINPSRKDFDRNGENWNKTDIDYDFVGSEFIQEIAEQNKYDESLLLWDALLKETDPDKAIAYYQANGSRRLEERESYLSYLLRRMRWIPNKEGVFCRPCDVSADDLYKGFSFVSSARFLLRIGFGNINKAPNDALSALEKANIPLTEADKAWFDSSPEDKEAFLEFQKNRKEQKERKGLSDAILDENKEQLEGEEFDDYGRNIAVSNAEKRAKKQHEQFIEGLQKKSPVRYVLRYTGVTASKDEKNYVAQQYHGKCQICGRDPIIKHNGKIFFNAINIISTAKLDKQLLNNLDAGWNTLSLCPNCAAEYLYCSKNLDDFESQIENLEVENKKNEYIIIQIILRGKTVMIKFTPRHFIALKEAFKVYKEQEEKE